MQAWARKSHHYQEQSARWQELESWYLRQPARRCKSCDQLQPASAFGGTFSARGFVLHTRCKRCHSAFLEQRLPVCCVCQKKTLHADFLTHFNGYALHDNGISLALCCKTCETTLLSFPEAQQRRFIQGCCQRTFLSGQVIYAEVDPETHEPRYIGRTNQPGRRHNQHLRDTSELPAQWGPEKKPWYTRGNWIKSLIDKDLKPSMQILQTIHPAPLVLEWEQRYIWHAIQEDWSLLNLEAMDEVLTNRIKNSSLNFLAAPFESLLQQHFFSPGSLIAFLRQWHL